MTIGPSEVSSCTTLSISEQELPNRKVAASAVRAVRMVDALMSWNLHGSTHRSYPDRGSTIELRVYAGGVEVAVLSSVAAARRQKTID